MALDAALQRQFPWAKFVLSRDTIVPHRIPITLARCLHQICTAVLSEVLAAEEVTSPTAYNALALIHDFPGIDQRRLAVLMGIDRTNIGQIIDELEAKRLVERRVNNADRRARELRLTVRGESLRRRILPRNLAAQGAVLAVLKPAERVKLIGLLTRIVETNEVHVRPGTGRRRPQKRARVARDLKGGTL